MLKKILVWFQIKDVSFGNLFWRKFAIRLVALSIISFTLLYFAQIAVVDVCEQQINGEIAATSLELAQMGDRGEYVDRFTATTNVVLSELYEMINSNPFVVDSSVYFYDTTNGRLIARSFEIPVVRSAEAIDWWKETSRENGTPAISLTDDALVFCRQYKNHTLYIENVGCVNSVLLPSTIVAKTKLGKELDRYDITVPSSLENMTMYKEQMKIELIGNQIDDTIYGMMMSVSLQSESAANQNTESQPTEPGNTQPTESIGEPMSIIYPDEFDAKNIQIVSKNFTINETEYQIDCGYQLNFWFGAWKIVAIAEILCILLCVATALINTKETLTIYR